MIAPTGPVCRCLVAAWGLRCRNCGSTFVHSQIEDTIENYYFPPRPTVPDDGIKIDCPHCGENATYLSKDFVYQSEG
jgi:DNA-directed RNA polymerase subunit RPC12/RpoP